MTLLQACLHNLEETLICCNKIGYPVMLKASWGGGGKGIRKVTIYAIGHAEMRQLTSTVPVCLDSRAS